MPYSVHSPLILTAGMPNHLPSHPSACYSTPVPITSAAALASTHHTPPSLGTSPTLRHHLAPPLSILRITTACVAFPTSMPPPASAITSPTMVPICAHSVTA